MQSVAEGEREPAVPAEGRTTMDRWNVGILIFDGVEVLDFAGPFEVFSRTRLTPGSDSRRSDDSAPFSVFTVAKSRAPVRATGDLEVVPRHGFADAPHIDLLLVPGGFGTRRLVDDPETLDHEECHVEAGGHAGRGDDAVVHHALVAHHPDARVDLLQQVEGEEMSGGAPALQQARAREQE